MAATSELEEAGPPHWTGRAPRLSGRPGGLQGREGPEAAPVILGYSAPVFLPPSGAVLGIPVLSVSRTPVCGKFGLKKLSPPVSIGKTCPLRSQEGTKVPP